MQITAFTITQNLNNPTDRCLVRVSRQFVNIGLKFV